MTLDTTEKRRDIHPLIWLGLPLSLLALRIITPLFGEAIWKRLMWGEARLSNMRQGNLAIPENLTVGLLLPAFVLGILIFRRRRELPKWIGLVMLLGGVASLWFALEECSYGQDYVGFRTPEWMAQRNDQGEFNFHRTSEWLSNVPRQVLLIGTIIGGIILPLVLRRRLAAPEAPKSPWFWLIPNYRLVLISAMAVLLRLPDRLDNYFAPPAKGSYLDLAFFAGSGEYKEVCFAAMMLLYLLSVYLRTGERAAAAAK